MKKGKRERPQQAEMSEEDGEGEDGEGEEEAEEEDDDAQQGNEEDDEETGTLSYFIDHPFCFCCTFSVTKGFCFQLNAGSDSCSKRTS